MERWTSRVVCWLLLMLAALGVTGRTCASQAEKGIVLQVRVETEGSGPEDGTITLVLWNAQRQILQRKEHTGAVVEFTPLIHVVPGRYIYYITQEAGNRLNMAYDSGVWQLVVEVVRDGDILRVQVTEVNRVCGDWTEAPEILESYGPGYVPVFHNELRQGMEDLPRLAEVPRTGTGAAWCILSVWSLVTLFGLQMVCGTSAKRRLRRNNL